MTEIFNSAMLKDRTIEPYKKLKTTIYLKKQTYQKLDSIAALDDLRSRNEATEKAVDFYFAYVSGDLSQDFLCGVYGKKMEGTLNTLANRISRLQFKQAVELDMITRLLSSDLEITKDKYERLRKASVDSVKKNNGSINILEAATNTDEMTAR